ncbi:MAG: Gfo/Idh/MocA family oxidoreductase [Candidatus Latescibacterota bacterium]|jgi:predicted dehydrogenase
MAAKVRAAVIGLGWPGKEHLKGYQACSGAEVVAVCDWDEPLLAQVADEFGVKQRFTDYKEMIASPEIDVVSVAVPNYEHAPLTIDCLKAGKHVLCEKPPAMNAPEAQAMADAAKAGRKTLMYAFVMRWYPQVRYLKSLIEAGELGDVYLGKAGYTRRRGIPRGKDNWFIDKKRAGGGALIDIGVHALDCVWYLMGTPKPVYVMGSAYHQFGYTVPEEITFDVDDAAVGLIRFANGATLFLEASWAWNLPGTAVKQIAGTKGGADLEPFRLFTEKNGVVLDTDLAQGGMPEGYGDAPSNPFFGEVAHFVEVVSGRARLIATPEQGVQLMQMLDAVYASSETGKGVALG